MKRERSVLRAAFTLIELLMASAAAALILLAVYGVFGQAMRMRDNAMERTRVMRLQGRAIALLRNDLQNARVSGGKLAATLEGSQTSASSSFPGYLKFTSTTAREDSDLEPMGDVQQIEYFVVADAEATGGDQGVLVRTVNRNLLAETEEVPVEEPVLTGVKGMSVSFYDGQSWKDTWEVTEEEKTLPEGVRVVIEQAPTVKQPAPAPLEVLVAWTTQPAIPAPSQ